MRTLKLALRNVAGSRRGQLGKIVFLGAGLAAGLVLLTKVCFEQSYDEFYPDDDRIYQIASRWLDPDEPEEDISMRTSGGYAPLIQEMFPQIEVSSRYMPFGMGSDQVFYVGPERQRLKAYGIFADENFYNILPRPMITGVPQEILTRPMSVMVSEKIARMIDGDPVGQTLVFDNYPGKALTITGIFEDVPRNSLHRYDFAISMESLPSFEWDGRNNLDGNDRYFSFLKLVRGADADQLQKSIDEVLAEHELIKELREMGWDFGLQLIPLRDVHKKDSTTRSVAFVLLILAGAILFATIFNYLLVVLSDTMTRGKSVAVMKSYGAGFREIAASVLAETAIQLAVLFVTAVLVVLIFRNSAEQMMGNSIGDLLTWRSGLVVLGVLLVILFVSSYVQGRIYNNISVTDVFRNYTSRGRMVKLALLFVQVTAAAFLTMLLVTVTRQYNAMVNDDPGYEYDRLLITYLYGVESSQKQAILHALEGLDVVEGVSLAYYPPVSYVGGNNIYHPDTGHEIFNIADLMKADYNYLPILGIGVVEGRGFEEGISASGDMMVSRSFVDKIQSFMDWPDGVVGKDIAMTQHGRVTITGVYDDFKIGNSLYRDMRPSVLLYSATEGSMVLIKMKELGSEAIGKVNGLFDRMLPDKEVTVSVYSDMMMLAYVDYLKYSKAITVASVIVLIIVLVGLVGYMRDETVRRQKEIAIRKINGATVADILRMLGRGIMVMMGPALVVGITVSCIATGIFVQEFAVSVPFSVPAAALCAVALTAVALAAVSLSALKVARKNPAETVKTE